MTHVAQWSFMKAREGLRGGLARNSGSIRDCVDESCGLAIVDFSMG